MSVVKMRGVVIRERDTGESDKALTLLTKENGRLFVTAKGARRPGSKFMAGAHLFTYADFVLFQTNHFYAASQIDVIEPFYALRTDYDRLCVGNYFTELLDKTVLEDTPCEGFLYILVHCLSQLAKKTREPAFVARVFEFRFFAQHGMEPEMECCTSCGGELEGRVYFGADGTLCEACRVPSAVKLSPAAVAAIRFILSANPKGMFGFTLADAPLRELQQASGLFLRSHFNVQLKSLAMIDA